MSSSIPIGIASAASPAIRAMRRSKRNWRRSRRSTFRPSILHGADDGVMPHRGSEAHGKYFTGPYQRRVLAGVGHNPPQEAPQAFAEAVLELCRNA